MSQLLLIHPNPKKRRGKKRRSAAQRAATARMLAANPRSSGSGRKRKYRRSAVGRVRRSVRRYSRRAGRSLRSFSVSGVVPMVKNAGMGAAGALGVDIAYGAASRFLPAAVLSPIGADGKMNYAYYAAKGAAAVALGVLAGKVISPTAAHKMAEGSLTVTLYDAVKSMIPAGSVPMGYASSAQIARGNVRRISEYVRQGAAPNRAMSRELREYVRR